MRKQSGFISRAKSLTLYAFITAYMILLAAPLTMSVFAQEVEPALEPVPCVAPANVPRPTGSSGHTYTWNCETLLWENAYYTLDPNTRITTPKYAPETSFNATTNLWEVREWQYVASNGGYEYRISRTYAPTPPPSENSQADISNTGPDSNNTIENADGSITNTGPNSSNTILGDGGNGTGTILNTGPESSNTIDLADGSYQAGIDLDINLTIDTGIASAAISGDAAVLQNTNAGSALSGDAASIANILNMLQSSWGGGLPELYVADIQGDYFGDIMIDPSLLLGATTAGCGCGDLTVNASTDATINNDVDLLAQTGNATVSQNTTAGDATSGNATALANVVNMINSSITSGQSFLGVLNIHGNLNGDVLVAQDVIDELLAANVPTAEIALCDCGDMLAEFTDNQTITNNIVTSAETGAATVSQNTTAGNATSGSAQTSVTVFNVTGRQIVGQNALLVFVNVLGEWIGFLVDTPGGSTAAMYGGAIDENSLSQPGDTTYNSETNATINNDITVTALTGDAEVSMNTLAGDATSGNADASANVSNIVGSNFSLSGWFGLLFINIMGDWFGSFGVNTPYGDTSSPTTTGQGVVQSYSASTNGVSIVGVPGASVRRLGPTVRVFEAAVASSNEDGTVVLAGITEATPPTSNAESFGATNTSRMQNTIVGWSLMALGAGIIVYFFRKNRNMTYGQ